MSLYTKQSHKRVLTSFFPMTLKDTVFISQPRSPFHVQLQ